MENMEIEKVVEEVVENVQEIIPAPTQSKNGISLGEAAGTAAVVYCICEGVKYAVGKVRNANRKRKARKLLEEDVMTADIVIDENDPVQ